MVGAMVRGPMKRMKRPMRPEKPTKIWKSEPTMKEPCNWRQTRGPQSDCGIAQIILVFTRVEDLSKSSMNLYLVLSPKLIYYLVYPVGGAIVAYWDLGPIGEYCSPVKEGTKSGSSADLYRKLFPSLSTLEPQNRRALKSRVGVWCLFIIPVTNLYQCHKIIWLAEK